MEKVHWKILRLVHTSQSQNNKTPGGKKKYWEWIEEGTEKDGSAGKKKNQIKSELRVIFTNTH